MSDESKFPEPTCSKLKFRHKILKLADRLKNGDMFNIRNPAGCRGDVWREIENSSGHTIASQFGNTGEFFVIRPIKKYQDFK